MEDVALVASEQQKFQKSIKGIKKLLKSGKIKPRTDEDAKRASVFQRKGLKKPKKDKGLVYISHIPHGFYENEMTQYFRQFGVVTNVRVLRSARTGRSKGAAFVEFLEPAVAQIVAETMNNYLMGKRLLKAVLIPPEKQRTNAFRKNWNTFQNPGSEYRRKMKKLHNKNSTDEDDLKLARKQIKNVLQTKRKLKEMGIDYDFFSPVDVPSQLLPLLEVTTTVPTQVQKKFKEQLKSEVKKENVKMNKMAKKDNLKDKKSDKVEVKKEKIKPIAKKPKLEGQDFIKIHLENKNGKKSQHDEIVHSNDNSDDSNDDFDSDEFEMAVDSDEEFESGDDDGSDEGREDGEGDESEDDNGRSDASKDDVDISDEEIPPPKLGNIKQSIPKNKVQIKNNGAKSGAVPQQNGGKLKLEQKSGADKKQKKRNKNRQTNHNNKINKARK